MRNHAAWGLFLCVLLLGAGFYLYRPLSLSSSPPIISSALLIVVMGILYLLAWLTNPRRAGCRLYAFFITILAFCGLGLSAQHLWTQSQLAPTLAACAPGSWSLTGANSLSQYFLPLIEGVRFCRDAVLLHGLPVGYLLLLTFLFFSFFGLYLLFMRIDRPIFR